MTVECIKISVSTINVSLDTKIVMISFYYKVRSYKWWRISCLSWNKITKDVFTPETAMVRSIRSSLLMSVRCELLSNSLCRCRYMRAISNAGRLTISRTSTNDSGLQSPGSLLSLVTTFNAPR
jgi:hypothetical protein